jgi:hypothetical protein
MTDNLRDATIIARGGLYTNEDALTLAATQPGSAIRLTNFEISQFGGYRRINGFSAFDASNPTVPGTGAVLGLWIHQDKVYAARRNAVDSTSATLPAGAVSVSSGSTTVTVVSTAHGLSTGELISFVNVSTLGSLTFTGREFPVATVTSANGFTFLSSSAAASTEVSSAANISYTVSKFYSIFEHTSTSGWTNISTASSIHTQSAIGVTRLRTSDHSFTGKEVLVIVDGVNKPIRQSTADFLQIYDRQGTSATDTENQLSNPFSTSNGDATVTVVHADHGLSTGDIVRFTNINVDLGGQSANSLDFTVATVVSTASYTFELATASSVSSQNNVGGTAVNWFYIHETNQFDIEGASLVDDFRNHTFFAGMSAFPNFLVFSAPNNDLDYTAASGGGAINVGFPITAIVKFRDSLFIFGKDKIKRITGNNATDFVLSEVANNTGCIATDSVIEIGGDVLFLAADGIRPLQGTARIGDVELQTVSKPIQQLLRALPSSFDLSLLNSVVVRNKSQFRYFFPTSTVAQADAQGIIGGLRFADNRVGWEFGELLGIRSFIATSGLINNIERVLHGDSNGNVFEQEVGNDFAGEDILAVYATPFFYFDSTEKRKTFQKVSIFTRPEGSADFNMAVYFDWDDPAKLNPGSYSLSTQGALLRYFTTGGTYGSSFTFGGSSSPVLEKQIQGSGRAMGLVITSLGTQAPYSIQGWGLTWQPAGYR